MTTLKEAVILYLKEQRMSKIITDDVANIFDEYDRPVMVEVQQQPQPMPEQPVITHVGINKLRLMTAADINWRAHNVHAFGITYIKGLVYRWITVSYSGGYADTDFLLVSPTAVTAAQIRNQIMQFGLNHFVNSNLLGASHHPSNLGIRSIEPPGRFMSPSVILYASYRNGQFALDTAGGIVLR